MKRFVEGEDRRQATLLPECLDDYVVPDNPVRIIEAFVDELDLGAPGFAGVVPEATGRPAYHPATLLKIYIYSYLNRLPSSRRLESNIGGIRPGPRKSLVKLHLPARGTLIEVRPLSIDGLTGYLFLT